MPCATILDYGIGNLYSLKCSLERAGFKVTITASPIGLGETDVMVFPGVGSFPTASHNLKPFKAKILDLIDRGVAVLGVCLGMQLLFDESEEGGGEGLSVLRGRVVKLSSSVKVPHIGWNLSLIHI